MDSTFSNELLSALFNEMKEFGSTYVTLDKMLKEFDVYKKESNINLIFKLLKDL